MERSLTIGWQAERFARTKNIRDPQHWFQASKASPEAAAADLRGMISRMAQRQGGAHGNG